MNTSNFIEKLNSIVDGVGYLAPEAVLLTAACLMLIGELIFPNQKLVLKSITGLAFLAATVSIVFTSHYEGTLFSQALRLDGLARFFEGVFVVVIATVLIFPKRPDDLRNRGEYHFLLFAILLGTFFVVKSQNLILFYLGIETISISSYVLTTFGFRKNNYEAGIKYLLFGALASGVMLYGISLIYGFSGSLDLSDIAAAFSGGLTGLHQLAIVFLLAGVFFKLSMVPMHIWLPDVYEASPAPILAVFSTLPKLAVSVFLFRFISVLGLGSAQDYIITIIVVMAILSMLIGNLSAIWQQNVKRLLGYSSVAHAGFLVVGLVVGTAFGLQAFAFYGLVYGIMNLGVFYVVEIMENHGVVNVREYAGLGRTFPGLAVVMIVLMISLTGLPPTGGFIGKLMIFTSLWEVYASETNSLFLLLFVIGLANTVIALFYYLKIPYYMVFKTSQEQQSISFSLKDKIVLVVFTLLIVLTFFQADLLVNITNKINFAL